MNTAVFQFTYGVYASIDELNEEDMTLVQEARLITEKAYAPYSQFKVGAVALLANGKRVTGTNQENAAYPVGICAERALLASVAMLHPEIAIATMAISYHSFRGTNDFPISPCGMCRQSLIEYEERVQQPIRLILTGQKGQVYIIEQANSLLPLSFGSNDLK